MATAIHLALKEIWRNKGRFLLFSLVIALIAVLILFVAALSEGLGSGNREYLEKLNADLVVYQDIADLSIPNSRIDRSTLRLMRSLEGVRDVGPISFASVSIPLGVGEDPLDVSLVGLEPGRPGEPAAVQGRNLERRQADEVLIDRTVALVTGAQAGDALVVGSIRGQDEEFYTLTIVGITDSRKYGLRPSIFVPDFTWEKVRPQGTDASSEAELTYNVAAVQLQDPTQIGPMSARIEASIDRVRAVDTQTAYQNTPGYSEQQSTLEAQRSFALLIGLLVIGGFFQIQTLQKVPQIGMLKAVGTPNSLIAVASIIQIVAITFLGVIIGSAISFLLALGFPPNIPIIFTPASAAVAIVSILVIGPLGGLVSIRQSLRVEPLTALGLSS